MSVMEMKGSRPPHVEFSLRPMEDRAATLLANDGSIVMKDEAWAVVYQPGCKDCSEFPAEQWLAQMEQESRLRPKQMPPQWAKAFRQVYKDWRNGVVGEVNGTSVRHVSIYTPAEAANLLRINIGTVEDAAAMNSEALRHYGLGGVLVKQKSEDYMKSKDANKTAVEMTQLREQNTSLQGQLEAQQEAMNEMRAQLSVLNAGAKAAQVKRA